MSPFVLRIFLVVHVICGALPITASAASWGRETQLKREESVTFPGALKVTYVRWGHKRLNDGSEEDYVEFQVGLAQETQTLRFVSADQVPQIWKKFSFQLSKTQSNDQSSATVIVKRLN